ncbi:zinc finger protein 423 [Ceratitis capitata]|uniref:zinc finger protein 423 n=1 Tax=Ceratitis capitata TaxID=7213 RepID=UPI00032A1308|nr:zinc finger protein 423 [Ceratitis capitata]
MSNIAIKTEKLDEEQQEEIGIENRAESEDGVSSRQDHVKITTSLDMCNSAGGAKRQLEMGRKTNMRQPQQIPPQPTALLKNNSTSCDSNSGLVNPSHEINNTKKSALSKSRCGEVFVSNNARQWTFICTFCNKSTRDIGEFICHIKIKHLGGFADDGDETDDGEYDGNQPSNFYEQDQDYLDCGNYLDVNVHTESEDYSVNGQDHLASYRQQMGINNAPQRHTSVDTAASEAKSQVDGNKKKKINNVENMQHSGENDANFQSYPNKNTQKTSTPVVNMKNNANGGDSMTYDASDYTSGKDDFDLTNPYDNEDEEDFDNQLFIAPNDSLDASATDGREMKAKRRQIRGTAYCALCNKTFQYYSLYRNHMIKHSNETPFKCPICKKGFKSKQAIRYHMNTHQKEKQFKCTVCSASYGTENHFISHIMTHESATAFPCLVCGQVLSSSKERDIHMANHKEERPFRCDYCNKLFRLRHHLSNHLKMHRKYRCDYCKEIFTSAIYLRKPYACPGCENTPEARRDSANTASAKVGRIAGSSNVNPLEIFETVIPGQTQQGNEFAQMVTDSEGEGDEDDEDDEDEDENDNGEDDDDDNEAQGSRMEEDGVENDQHMTRRAAEQIDTDDDDEDTYEDSVSASTGTIGSAGHRLNAYGDAAGGGIKRYVCKFCSRKYSHPSGLNYHMRHKHR